MKPEQSRLQIRYATSWWARMRGLLAYPPLRLGQGLLIRPCWAVHSLGMRYSLDLVFLDAQHRIVKMGVLPPASWMGCRAACSVLELAPGSLAHFGWRQGERLWLGE